MEKRSVPTQEVSGSIQINDSEHNRLSLNCNLSWDWPVLKNKKYRHRMCHCDNSNWRRILKILLGQLCLSFFCLSNLSSLTDEVKKASRTEFLKS